MEVHHHSHHGKKRWTEYFWEFLMLFLAVSLGFFVENFREKLVEKHRAHDFAISLLSDLKKDTAILNSDIEEIDFVSPKIDTFRTLAQTKDINSLPGGTWYYYARFTSYYYSFNSNDATIEQLKSSGSLRYFKNTEVINAIAQYDKVCRSIKDLYNYDQPIIDKMVELRSKIFIGIHFDSVMDFNISREKINLYMQKDFSFMDKNPAMLNELANFCQLTIRDAFNRQNAYHRALILATDLIKLLKQEYDLK